MVWFVHMVELCAAITKFCFWRKCNKVGECSQCNNERVKTGSVVTSVPSMAWPSLSTCFGPVCSTLPLTHCTPSTWSPEYSSNMFCQHVQDWQPQTLTLLLPLPETLPQVTCMTALPLRSVSDRRPPAVTPYKSSSHCLPLSRPPHPSSPYPALLFSTALTATWHRTYFHVYLLSVPHEECQLHEDRGLVCFAHCCVPITAWAISKYLWDEWIKHLTMFRGFCTKPLGDG